MAEDYKGWTKARLQAELRLRGLRSAGRVAELRDRLRADDQQAQQDEASGQETGGSQQGEQQGGEEQTTAGGDQGEPEEQQRSGPEEQQRSDQGDQERADRDRPAGGSESEQEDGEDHFEGEAEPKEVAELGTVQLAKKAAGQLRSATGRRVEKVSGLSATEDGWSVFVDVVEHARVPASGDLLATYEVTSDHEGRMRGYRRIRRFFRNRVSVS